MEALFDLGITIIKVYLVSYVYVKLYQYLTKKFQYVNLISKLPKIKTKSAFKTARILISVSLILFSLTYWGNKGYGDEAFIPIGHYKHIHQSNGIQAYIEPYNYKYGILNIEKFAICNNLVFGEAVGSTVDKPLPFFVWNYKTEELYFFKTEEQFQDFLKTKKIDQFSLKSFGSNYVAYWNIRMILMA